jgi:2-oxo-hept-3-ene-1,7-dioate hydratase
MAAEVSLSGFERRTRALSIVARHRCYAATRNITAIASSDAGRYCRTMAVSESDIQRAAARLDQAERTRVQIRQLSIEHPAITVADAYAIQRTWIDIKTAAGRSVRGHKIGLTSKAMQSQLGIGEPDSGVLLDDMFFGDGGVVPSERFIATRIEAELAFVIKHRLTGPGCTIFDVLNATDFVVPALEILDTRIQRVDPETKSTRKIFDTIADNAANAGIVLGGRPIRPLDVDLRWIGALTYKNGQLEETGLAAGVLNHPATAVAWLANRIAPQGLSLEPGQVVLAGSFIRAIETAKGDTIHADYGPYGSVSCYFG